MRVRALLLVSLLAAASALATPFECEHTAPHRLTAPLSGATSVVVVGRAGSLRVTGSSGHTVTASGTACASDTEFLAGMRLEARREGSELRIEAIIPERTTVFGWHDARLDFEVTVPDHLPVRIKDGSGSTEIRNVAQLEVTDGSGELEIRGVRGNVQVDDGSGSVSIEDVGGDVRLTDGSGAVEIEGVRGSVHVLEDGSGGLDIRDVQRDVTVDSDGSGGIDVSDVRGNFTVSRDGSGGVQFDRVGGTVRIPRS